MWWCAVGRSARRVPRAALGCAVQDALARHTAGRCSERATRVAAGQRSGALGRGSAESSPGRTWGRGLGARHRAGRAVRGAWAKGDSGRRGGQGGGAGGRDVSSNRGRGHGRPGRGEQDITGRRSKGVGTWARSSGTGLGAGRREPLHYTNYSVQQGAKLHHFRLEGLQGRRAATDRRWRGCAAVTEESQLLTQSFQRGSAWAGGTRCGGGRAGRGQESRRDTSERQARVLGRRQDGGRCPWQGRCRRV